MDQPEILATFLSGRVLVLVADITAQNVDAIVNAANSTLLGGGGVDGAIHRKGGPQILAECKEIRRTRYPDGLPTGEVVLTTGGLLAARLTSRRSAPAVPGGSRQRHAPAVRSGGSRQRYAPATGPGGSRRRRGPETFSAGGAALRRWAFRRA